MRSKKILNLFIFMVGVFFFLIGGVSASKYIVIDYNLSNTSDPNNHQIQGEDVIGDYGKGVNSYFKRLSLESDTSGSDFSGYKSTNRIVYCADELAGYPGVDGPVEWNCSAVTKNKKELAYIMANGYQNSTKVDYNDYYITQMAVWYFADPGDAFKNFPSSLNANDVSNSNAKRIINLINAAKDQDAELNMTIDGNNTKMSLTSDGKYYISNVITLSGKNLVEQIIIDVSGATGAFVTKDKNATSGTKEFNVGEKFYIKVPTNSVSQSTKIKITASSKYRVYNGTVNRCTKNKEIQDLIDYIPDDKNVSITKSLEVTASKNSVVISKQDIAGSKELPGAKLVIKQGNTEIDSWVSTTSPHTVYLSPGTYILEETIAPNGYIKSTEKIEFVVTADNKVTVNGKAVTSVVMKNNPITVYISKKSINGKTELPGAKLKITDKEGKIVKDLDGKDLEWVSTTKEAKFHLGAGTYYLTEIVAPEGYELSETTLEFTVTEDGKVKMNKKDVDGNLIVFTNTPEPEQVKTGSFMLYIVIIGIISVGLVTYYVMKRQEV